MELDWDTSNARCGELVTGATLAYIPDFPANMNIINFFTSGFIDNGDGYVHLKWIVPLVQFSKSNTAVPHIFCTNNLLSE